MKRKVLRSFAALMTVLLAVSLAGCVFMFTIIGIDDYQVDPTGLVNPPVTVSITTKGFIPKWPDVLVLVISGNVSNVGLTEEQIDDLADALSGTMYDHLDFDEFSGSTFEGDPFWVSKEVDIPDFWDLLPLPTGGVSPALGPFELDLSDVLGDAFYTALVDEMTSLCDVELPTGTIVDLSLEGTLKTLFGQELGTLDCDFTLSSEEWE